MPILHPRSPKTRKLLDGSRRINEAETMTCKVETHCPRKWAFVDMEDGNIWIPNISSKKDVHGMWRTATKSDLKCISRAVWQYNREWDGFKWVKKGKRRTQ